MKNIYLLGLLVLMLLTNYVHAQWETVTSFNQVILDLKVFDGKLFVGGGFTENEGSTCYWSASYNGSSMSRHTNMIGGGGLRNLDVFNGELYGVGSLSHGGSTGVSKWYNNTWENGGSTNISHSVIYADNNYLYVSSDDGLVRRKSAGGVFEEFYDFDGTGGVLCIFSYNDKLIFGGSFSNIDGTDANNIAQFDGASWQPLGTGLSGTVSCMAVYNNDLFVAGSFEEAGGETVSDIARWDGNSWHDVGGGVTGFSYNGIRDIEVFNNELYFVGDISEVGNVASENIIKWDGSEWKAVDIEHNASFFSCIEVYNDKLYVGEYDFDESFLFQYTSSADINEMSEISNFSLSPNPVKNRLNINFDFKGSGDFEIQILDMIGNVVLEKNMHGINHLNTTINCNQLSKGTYIILILDNESKAEVKRDKIVVI